MKFNKTTKRVLEFRRQKRDMLKSGYRFLDEIEWKINRGAEYNMTITDVKLGLNGNSLFYKVERRI